MIRMIRALWRRFYAWRHARRHPVHYAAAGTVVAGQYVCGRDHPLNAYQAGSMTWQGARPAAADRSRYAEILSGPAAR